MTKNRTDIFQEGFEVDFGKTYEDVEEEFLIWLTAQKSMRGIPEEMHDTDYHNELN